MNRRTFVQAMAGAAAAGTATRAGAQTFTLPAGARRARLDAAPAALDLDLDRTAVLVIDMQNDFGTVGGCFERAGIDISSIQAAVPPTARALDVARQARLPIVYLKMGFKPDLSDAGPVDSPNYRRHVDLLHVGRTVRAPNGAESRLLIRDTWNTDIVDALAPKAGDIVMYKHRFSGFYETDLHETLRRRRITSLVVTGCTTSICVESTIRDAMFRDYSCVLLKDCSAEPIGQGMSRTNHEASLLSIEALLGWTATSDGFARALTANSIA